MEITLVTIILCGALYLFATERLPVDLTALGILVALMATGILTPREALGGFANPAPVTVGALFVVTRGLTRTGSLDFLGRLLANVTRGRPWALLAAVLLVTGAVSSLINNTPVVVLFTALIISICARYSLAPSKFLMPISFVSILAGTTTLVGTSTNIIVSDLIAEAGLAPLSMFELFPLGFPLAIIGASLLFLLAPRLLPEHHSPTFERSESEQGKYLSEMLVPADSPLTDRIPQEGLQDDYADVEVFEVIRNDHTYDPMTTRCVLASGDILLVKGSASDLARMLQEKLVVLPAVDQAVAANPFDPNSLIVELIVPPSSALLGRRLNDTHLGFGREIHAIGVKRRQVHYSAQKMSDLYLSVGDILLVQCPLEDIDVLRGDGDVIVVEDVVHTIVNRRRAPVAITIFVAMIAAVTLGMIDILVGSLTAAFLMIVTGCLSLRCAYRSIDVRILLLIIGTIALGSALHQTGAAALYARYFLSVFADAGPRAVLSGLILLTSILSHFLSNNATAVLLVPVGISVASTLGVDPRPFMIGICFGASACFGSPIGYQTNLLVYGPGGYRFGDYLKLGMPLNLLVWGGASVGVPLLWPL
jgi:di/tricarboxylate transporter